MKTTFKAALLMAPILVGCSGNPATHDAPPTQPVVVDAKPRCLLADPFRAVAAPAQVAIEDEMRRAPESEKRNLKISVERTAARAAPPVDAKVVATQAAYLARAQQLADNFSGSQEELATALGTMKASMLAGRPAIP